MIFALSAVTLALTAIARRVTTRFLILPLPFEYCDCSLVLLLFHKCDVARSNSRPAYSFFPSLSSFFIASATFGVLIISGNVVSHTR